ncbi:MAG: component of SufBCD complex [Rhodobacteraceae bacterium]|nr:MAG: component of SufBCD complex [Paracoccaceae bacterium]
MTFLENIFGLIDMRSFSSVWFWIVLALYWSSVSQFVLGAPYDLIIRARKGDNAQDMHDLQTLVEVHGRRRLTMMRRAGHWIVAFAMALLTTIYMLAFHYGVEFAQAVFALILPLMIVRLMSLRLAFRIEREHLSEARLCRALLTHRFWVQALGVVTIFVTAVWGMFQVMSRSTLGF